MNIREYNEIWEKYCYNKHYEKRWTNEYKEFEKVIEKLVDRLVPIDEDDLKKEIDYNTIDYEVSLLENDDKWTILKFYTEPEKTCWQDAIDECEIDLHCISNRVRKHYLKDLQREKDNEME